MKYQENISENKTKATAASTNSGTTAIQLKDNREFSTIQMVLKPGKNPAVEANLISQYHADEDNGDAISITSHKAQDHQNAINHYKSAIRRRKSAGRMHVNQDGGHLMAIQTLNQKIQTRQAKISGINTQAQTGKKPKLPSLKW
ncbi:hypothetical protein [Flavobacterium ajazii]|uniref:hypothetical protein n=1 Tax=Flavobacterium ajazii TaxID=2692318 RepID=UPI0013D41D37|nr:hypothetical protein [Flavobacterium ajazii]